MFTMSDLPNAAYIRLDLFPAVLHSPALPDGVKDAVRLIVTDAYVLVFADTHSGPDLFFIAELDEFSGTAAHGYTILTTDGDEILARRSGGCGCGSRLRGIRPYPGVSFAARS